MQIPATRLNTVRDRRRVALSLLAVLLAVAPLFATVSELGAKERPLGLSELAEVIDGVEDGPLAAFRLDFATSYESIRHIAPMRATGRLKAGQDIYVHAGLLSETRDRRDLLPAPPGVRVLDGDLFFLGGESLVEVTLLLEATQTREVALESLERSFGKAAFEVVLPGSLNLLVGWQVDGALLLATFSDLPVFQLSAVPERPDDLLAGSQLVLFEGLRRYSEQRESGLADADSLADLEEVVRWVRTARETLRPIR